MDTHNSASSCSKWFTASLIVVAIGLALASSRAADARQTHVFTEREVAMLPNYCRYRLTRDANKEVDPADTERFERLLGPTYLHLHHYCYGLVFTNRARLSRLPASERNSWLSMSIGEFDYTIRNATADFVLLPEMLTKKGENLLRLRRVQDGVSALQRAIQTKPDYWPPYAVLSDYYKENGELDLARDWLEKGIGAASDARALEKRKLELKSPR